MWRVSKMTERLTADAEVAAALEDVVVVLLPARAPPGASGTPSSPSDLCVTLYATPPAILQLQRDECSVSLCAGGDSRSDNDEHDEPRERLELVGLLALLLEPLGAVAHARNVSISASSEPTARSDSLFGAVEVRGG